MSERHPELEPDEPDDSNGYGEHDDGLMPGERRRRVLRVVVLVALGAMVLPLVLSAYGVARSAADRVCAVYVGAYDTNATGFRVSFELFANGGPGWECFALAPGGAVQPLGNMGLLPAMPRLPQPDAPLERDA